MVGNFATKPDGANIIASNVTSGEPVAAIPTRSIFSSRRLSLSSIIDDSNGGAGPAVETNLLGSKTNTGIIFDMLGTDLPTHAPRSSSGGRLFSNSGCVDEEIVESNDDEGGDDDAAFVCPPERKGDRASSEAIPLPMSPVWLEAADKAPSFEDALHPDMGGDSSGGSGGNRSSTTSTQPRSSNEDAVVYPPRITRESVDNILGASAVVQIKRSTSNGGKMWDRAKAATLVSRVPRSPQLGRKARKGATFSGSAGHSTPSHAKTLGHGAHLGIPRHMSNIAQKTRRKSFFDIASDVSGNIGATDKSGDDSSGEQRGVVADCVSILESLTEHLWAAEKEASKVKGALPPPGVHTVETLDAAMDLSPIGKLRWCIYQMEHNFTGHKTKESSIDKINRLFKSKVSTMGKDGDEEDHRISAFIQQTFLGQRAPKVVLDNVVDVWKTSRSSSEPAKPNRASSLFAHGTRVSLDMTGHHGDDIEVTRALSLRSIKEQSLKDKHVKRNQSSIYRQSEPSGYTHHDVKSRQITASRDSDSALDVSATSLPVADSADKDDVDVKWIANRWESRWKSFTSVNDDGKKSTRKKIPSKTIEAGRLVFSAEAETMLNTIGTWGLNLFTLDTVTSGRPLVAVGLRSIEKFELYKKLKIDPLLCAKFFTAVENGYAKYPEVPYHNYLHGADVLHTTFALLQNPVLKDTFSDLEILAAILAAAAHDIGHPGVNNSFMVNTSHETAILYNDASVLENFHTATVFKLMGQEEYNVLGSLSPDDAKYVRRLMIGMILGTDMAKHVNHLAAFRDCMMLRIEEVARVTEEAEVAVADAEAEGNEPPAQPDLQGLLSPWEEKHRIILLEAIVHLSDLSTATKPWEQCRVWSARVLKEFIDQGHKETAFGIPMEPLNDGSQSNVGRGQKGFIAYVVAPLWEIWDDFVTAGKPEGTTCEPMDWLNKNLDQWEAISKSGDVTGHKFVADVLEIPIEEVAGTVVARDSVIGIIPGGRDSGAASGGGTDTSSDVPATKKVSSDDIPFPNAPTRSESQHGEHVDGVHSNDEASDHHDDGDDDDDDDDGNAPRMFARSHSWNGL